MKVLHLKNFWYILADSHELKKDAPLSRVLFEQALVLYRGSDGAPVILPDRCLHRCGKLSKGRVAEGKLQCPYHGWVYGDSGKVVSMPSEGPRNFPNLCLPPYTALEQDGYIYVCLEPHPAAPMPYSMPHYDEQGWQNLRLQHTFMNNVTNCVENFIDVPHTAFVHEGIFRKEEGRPIHTSIKRTQGTVAIDYLNESTNLGSMSWFLNPSKGKVVHVDHFIMPNITHVIYQLPSGWEYLITSQSIPVNEGQTLVYTDITYHFGIWTKLCSWMIKRQARKVISQDMEVLKDQWDVIKRTDGSFVNMPCDWIHKMISEIREALEKGVDPRTLPDKTKEITFYV